MSDATPDEIEKRLERLNFLAGHIGAKSGTPKADDWSEFYMRIPADPNHDADLIIGWVVRYVRELQRERDELKSINMNLRVTIENRERERDELKMLLALTLREYIGSLCYDEAGIENSVNDDDAVAMWENYVRKDNSDWPAPESTS